VEPGARNVFVRPVSIVGFVCVTQYLYKVGRQKNPANYLALAKGYKEW
jgi:hypothetical protein